MKTYQRNNEGWFEILPLSISQSQLAILSTNENSLTNFLKGLRKHIDENTSELESFYESIKPELKQDDVYELIAFDCKEAADSYSGILNCRVNGKHVQIRF